MSRDPLDVLRDSIPVGVLPLASAYRRGEVTLRQVVDQITGRIDDRAGDHVWISRVSGEDLTARIDHLERVGSDDGAEPALWGIPFAVKDNIDVAGLVTTAACPGFAYTATRTAPAVQRLLDAGAVLVGKTNLDQFATGLTGTRSPYGACESVFGGGLISGGSSSGSAVAVAAGLVSFALGTDTAGSGRVPAAMNGIVGLKPTRGLIPTTGVVAACRSLDCVSVFAPTVADASAVLGVAMGFDPTDPYSRAATGTAIEEPRPLRMGIPGPGQLDFFGDMAMEAAWEKALVGYTAGADRVVTIDIAPLLEAGDLLYGPWLAERLAGLRSFVAAHPEDILPITLSILRGGGKWSGADVFAAIHRLAELRLWAARVWRRVNVLVLPTIGTTFTLDQIEAQPVERNRMLGRYTQFANLLDTAALSLPAGVTADGRPASVTLVGPAHSDALLAGVAGPTAGWPMAMAAATPAGAGMAVAYKSAAPVSAAPVSAAHKPAAFTPAAPKSAARTPAALPVTIAVIGRHLLGQARNHELVDLGGTLAETTVTAPVYRLYRIGQDERAVPGLLRTGDDGVSIEVELWRLPSAAMGTFLPKIPPPLGLGWLQLGDGRSVLGFVCESYAVETAVDISASGGWRAYQLNAPSHETPEEP